jgi:hypothetical protein
MTGVAHFSSPFSIGAAMVGNPLVCPNLNGSLKREENMRKVYLKVNNLLQFLQIICGSGKNSATTKYRGNQFSGLNFRSADRRISLTLSNAEGLLKPRRDQLCDPN